MKFKCMINRDKGISEFKTLIRQGSTLEDKIGSETYGIVEGPRYIKKGKKFWPLYICNEQTGVTVKLRGQTEGIQETKDPQVLNAHSLTNIIDGKLFQTAFRLKIDIKTLLITLILGGFLGTMVGLML